MRWLGYVLMSLALVAIPPAQLGAREPEVSKQRVRIGLALSGGGARGCAHVGVLQVLEEMRVPVDYIAGTSMGAIVGGLYASGLSASELEQILSTMDWAAMGEDDQPRQDRAYRRKKDDQRYVMNLEIGLRGFVLPRGLRSGQRFTFELRRHAWPVVQISDFTKLPIPFTAVAADLESGKTVLLDRGSLPTAMRASMSIPGVFTPVEIDGRLLVDGGILNNLPIDVVRAMGADVVIAVDIGDQLVGREELESLLAVTSQAMTISSSVGVAEQRSRADLLLTPRVSDRGALDFTDVAGMIGEGADEARRYLSLLQDLSLSEADFAHHLESKRPPAVGPRLASRVDIRGLVRVDQRVVRRVMKTRIGEPLDFEVLRRDLGRIYGLGDFDLVDFEVVPEDDELVLVIDVREKKGGPFFLRSAFNLDLDEDQSTSASFLLNLTAFRLNALGAEWQTDVRIGSQQRIQTELYQPLDFAGRYFVEARLYEKRDLFSLIVDGRSVAELERLISGGGLDVGLTLGTVGEIRLGVFRERRDQHLETGEGVDTLPTVDIGGWHAAISIDRLDSIYFPNSGQLGSLGIQLARPSMGSDERFEIAALAHVGVVSSGRHTALSWVEIGTHLGDGQPPYAFFGGGGLFSFSGYSPGELFGASFAVFRPTYLYRLGTLPAMVGKGLYLGAWVEVGNYWPTRDSAGLDDLRYAATLTLGAETVIGPAYLAFGFAEQGRQQIYLSIGPSFSTSPR